MNARIAGILLTAVIVLLVTTRPSVGQAENSAAPKPAERGMVFRPFLVAGVIPVPWMRVQSVTLEAVNDVQHYRFEEIHYHYRGGPPMRPESWIASTHVYTVRRSLVESDRPKESGGLVRRPPGRRFVSPAKDRTGTPGYEATSYALFDEAPYPIPLDLGTMCTHLLLDPAYEVYGLDREHRAMGTKAERGDIVFYYVGTKATYVARVYAMTEDAKIADLIGKWGREEIWIHPPNVTPEGYGAPRLLFRKRR